MLDDEELVGALDSSYTGELIERSTISTILGVEPEVSAEVTCASALVVRGQGTSSMRSTSVSSKPASLARSAAWSRTGLRAGGKR